MDELFYAGRLIQWALRPEANPMRNQEYSTLIERYLDHLDFRDAVKKITAGLGLNIIGEIRPGYSIVLAPTPDSVFLMRSHDYRSPTSSSEDNRLLDGLIHIAIAATVYPRATDLLTHSTMRRNPITVNDIEVTLRQISERLEENSRGDPDPLAEGSEGVYEAWRVYKNRPATKETKDNRAAAGTTRRMIEKAFEYLCEQRCFRRDGENYQPLWRYQVLVQDYAASRVYQSVMRAIGSSEGMV